LGKNLLEIKKEKKAYFHFKKELKRHQRIIKRKDKKIEDLTKKLALTSAHIGPQIDENFEKILKLKEEIKYVSNTLSKNDLIRELKNLLCWHITLLEQKISINERELKREYNQELEVNINKLKNLKNKYESNLLYFVEKEKNPLHSPEIDTFIKIKDINLLNQNKKRVKCFKQGETIRIDFKYDAKHKVRNPIFEIRFHDIKGVTIANLKKSVKKISKGVGRINFEIKNLNLLGGRYLISAIILDSKSLKIYDLHEKAYYFKIDGENRPELGFINLQG
jgi:hypothetical protein